MKKFISKIIYPLWVPYYLRNFSNSFKNPKKYYGYCQIYLKNYAPEKLLEHRIYFQQDRRSFGEDAFVTMWYLLFKKFNFNNFLEIGIYRGQVISLMSLIASLEKKEISVTGISPLINAGDAVSSYPEIDYESDIKSHFSYFKLPQPTLVKEYSTSEKAVSTIAATKWDCIYIDGSHDYEIVKQDFYNTFPALKVGGILVFDDSSLNLDAGSFSGQFRGHPGPSEVVDKLVVPNMKEILRVGHNRCFMKTKPTLDEN